MSDKTQRESYEKFLTLKKVAPGTGGVALNHDPPAFLFFLGLVECNRLILTSPHG